MKKIFLSLFLALIALTFTACVCACDADNCTLEKCSESNVEICNLEIDHVDDCQIDNHKNSLKKADTKKVSAKKPTSKNKASDKDTKQQIEALKSYIITDFKTKASDYNNNYMEGYKPHGVTPDLVETVSRDYGSASVSLMAFRYGVSIGEIIDTVHEIKDGKHGKDLKNLLEKKDKENLKKIDDLSKKLNKC